MARDFDNFGHKNAELLRHYIIREMKKMNKKISSDSDQLLGCFVASLVDVLIVLIYDDMLKQLSLCCRLICIVVLLILFWVSSQIIVCVVKKRRINYILLENKKYDIENIKRHIDEFDNIACDGLLICKYYIKKYKEEGEEEGKMQEFYLYEIVHHLKKSVNIFNIIYDDKKLYIRSKVNDEDYKIDIYRIENFVKITKEVYSFLEKEINKHTEYKDDILCIDMDNIKIQLNEL